MGTKGACENGSASFVETRPIQRCLQLEPDGLGSDGFLIVKLQERVGAHSSVETVGFGDPTLFKYVSLSSPIS